MTLFIVILLIILIIGLILFINRNLNKIGLALFIPTILIPISISFSIDYFNQDLILYSIFWVIILIFSLVIIYAVLTNPKFRIINNVILKNDSIDLAKNHIEHHNNIINEENKVNANKKKSNVNLTDDQLKKIYYFFVDNNLFVYLNMDFKEFKDLFLKEPIRLKADIPTLREFYNNLKAQKNVIFKNITNDFLIFFINSNNNKIYDYKQFTKDAEPISSYTDKITTLFKEF